MHTYASKPFFTQRYIHLLTPVQNLTATLDPHKPSVMLEWDPPDNVGDVQTYDIRYRSSKSWWITPYRRTVVNCPATKLFLKRADGLKLFVTYDFDVRARNADYVGQWIRVSKYMGMYLYMLHLYFITFYHFH